MLTEAIRNWLAADNNFNAWPIFYQNIPQNHSTFPCIVICPPHSFDNGNTTKVTSSQKIIHFDVVVQGTNASSLTPAVNKLNSKFSAITNTPGQVVIGAFRCQCIQVLDINYSDGIYSSTPNDRRIPGATEKDYTWAIMPLRASYHQTT